MAENNTHETSLQLIISIIILGLIALGGFALYNNKKIASHLDCEFPQSSTDLRTAGLKLKDEVTGTVGYGETGFLTIESENGFVMLTPVYGTEVETQIKDQITQTLGCEGSTELSYWVFEVSDVDQLPPEMLDQLGDERPNQILVILGSMSVFPFPTSTENVGQIVTQITRSRIQNRTQTSPTGTGQFAPPSRSRSAIPFAPIPAPAPLELPPIIPTGGSSGFGGGSGTGSGGRSPGGSGGGSPGIPSTGGGTGCTLEIFCEDNTGTQYRPGRSGCQGEDFYAQTPTPPQGTRQVAVCVFGSGGTNPYCPFSNQFDFYRRQCNAQLNEIRMASGADFNVSNLPTSPTAPGQLFRVPGRSAGAEFTILDDVWSIRCSFASSWEEQHAIVRTGMCQADGEYCLPNYSPPGCTPNAPLPFCQNPTDFNPSSPVGTWACVPRNTW